MMSFERCGEIFTKRLFRIQPRTEMDTLLMQYGVTTIFYNLATAIGLVAVAIICSVLKEALLAIFVFASLRLLLGGVHCSTARGCFLVTTVCTVGNAMVSGYVYIPDLLYVGLAYLIIALTLRYGPSGTKQKYTNPKEVMLIKIKAVVLECIYILIGYYMMEVRTLMLFGMLAEVATLPIFNPKYRLKKEDV